MSPRSSDSTTTPHMASQRVQVRKWRAFEGDAEVLIGALGGNGDEAMGEGRRLTDRRSAKSAPMGPGGQRKASPRAPPAATGGDRLEGRKCRRATCTPADS